MPSARTYAGRKSSWQRTNSGAQLLVGVILIAVVGLFGLTRKSMFGIELIWPYAAMWGAVGWASVGLSLRPMVILVAFGLAQDVSFNAPLGSFVLVNLSTYALSAALRETFDVDSDPVRALFAAAAAMGCGTFVLWVLASSTADQVVQLVPLLAVYAVTLILFVPVAGAFRLGDGSGGTL
ncbi:MAG: hypothetical protein AAF292_02400 [Pseudomonadota bacterium]